MKRTTLLVVTFVAIAPQAWAQASERKGFLIGASIGLGNSSPDLCNDCDTGLAVEARVGTMLKPRLALLAYAGAVSTAPNILSDVRGRHNGLLAAVQYWPSERIWLRAGIGAASVEREDPPRYDYGTTHLAGIAGVGLEINPRSKLVFEVALSSFLSGDSEARFPTEPRHKSTVNSVILSLGATFYRH